MDKQQLLNEYKDVFKTNADAVYFSPGRINVIGEHTDYNGGHVFPCAISLGTYGAYGARNDQTVSLYSMNMDNGSIVSFDLNDEDPEKDEDKSWINYFKGMIVYLKELGYKIDHGFNLLIHGNLPYGAGLSSSASIELLMGTILKDQFNLDVGQLDLVKLGQKTENKYVGLNSGIMDQFAVGMGKKDNAIFLDCSTLEYKYLPLELGDYEIVIMSTNKKHSLASSKYNERVAECEEAVKRLNQKLDINKLGELDEKTFDQYTYLINDKTLIKRARHAVSENQRTLAAIDAMQKKDLEELGRLINASHISLHYDYEVSGKELDTLAENAWRQEGVLGARMIGGGFAGSAIAIVRKDKAEELKKNVGKIYREKIGYDASFYDAEIVDGPQRI
ncbi:galactokinase [Lactobacillus hominis]|uniref:Galactokinase n=1 Tax=Lactobacillus hominis DSM 23910 = CRBIP 24.179 TaxID=1423758 RepID=I7IVX7_9LACO|nr:galactokinase [Lactobacillus hominis]KRM84427.1 galactokinase [Lactobacillus hominis DSM 23910 = CRBIP 24.179]MCT3348507.1 galactokinase [Lactobacillus hominis]CCI82213.1 Galactokinase [Lactobacillus hominis DSM 23910 = CRBIP 24.179]